MKTELCLILNTPLKCYNAVTPLAPASPRHRKLNKSRNEPYCLLSASGCFLQFLSLLPKSTTFIKKTQTSPRPGISNPLNDVLSEQQTLPSVIYALKPVVSLKSCYQAWDWDKEFCSSVEHFFEISFCSSALGLMQWKMRRAPVVNVCRTHQKGKSMGAKPRRRFREAQTHPNEEEHDRRSHCLW